MASAPGSITIETNVFSFSAAISIAQSKVKNGAYLGHDKYTEFYQKTSAPLWLQLEDHTVNYSNLRDDPSRNI